MLCIFAKYDSALNVRIVSPEKGPYNLLVISSGGNSSCIPRLTKSQAQEFWRVFEVVDGAHGLLDVVVSFVNSGKAPRLMLSFSGGVRSGKMG